MRVTPVQLQSRIRDALTPVRIVKAEARRFCLGLAYPASRLDGHGEGMTPEDLEQVAWEYLDQRQIGLFHQDGTTGHARPVESYIYRGPDWELTDVSGGTQTITAGDWLLGAIWDPEPWRLVTTGKINGWSIDGVGKRRQVPRSTLITKHADPPSLEQAIRTAIRKGRG